MSSPVRRKILARSPFLHHVVQHRHRHPADQEGSDFPEHQRNGQSLENRFLLIINIAFLILGCFMNAIVIMVVFVPVIIPAAQALGIDLVHLGVVIVLNIMIGLSTPPYGSLLFVTSAISGVSLMTIIKEIVPMIFVMILVLLLITYVPQFVLFIPTLL